MSKKLHVHAFFLALSALWLNPTSARDIRLTQTNVTGTKPIVIDPKTEHDILLSTCDIDRPVIIRRRTQLVRFVPLVGGNALYTFTRIQSAGTLEQFLHSLHTHGLPYRTIYRIAHVSIDRGKKALKLRDVLFMSYRGHDWVIFSHKGKRAEQRYMLYRGKGSKAWAIIQAKRLIPAERARTNQYDMYQLIADWLVCQTAGDGDETMLKAIAQFLDRPKCTYTIGERGAASTRLINVWQRHNLPAEAIPSKASIAAAHALADAKYANLLGNRGWQSMKKISTFQKLLLAKSGRKPKRTRRRQVVHRRRKRLRTRTHVPTTHTTASIVTQALDKMLIAKQQALRAAHS